MTESKRYNSILQIIDDHLIPNEEAKKQRGEVFTPPDLVREMLFGLRKDKLREGVTEIFGIDKDGNFIDEPEENRVGGLPNEVWRNPDLKWLDPANGIGNFPVIAFYKLDYELSKVEGYMEKDKRRTHIINEMLYMMELDKGNCTTSRQIFKKIHSDPKANPKICCVDTLSLKYDDINKLTGVDKFDVIMGNPPFNPPKTETGSSGNYIWTNFVIKSFYMLNDSGYLVFVHPPGWKKPEDGELDYEYIKDGNHIKLNKKGEKTIKKISQGNIWNVLKKHGTFGFIYTNENRKSKKLEFLEYFPAVDYYVYKKDKSYKTCTVKNVFLGEIISEFNLKLDYSLKYLPNLITKETIYILSNVLNVDGTKPSFKRFRASSGFSSDRIGRKYKYLYLLNKNGEKKFQYSNTYDENIDKDKVVINWQGGIESYNVLFIKASEKLGTFDKVMHYYVNSVKDGNKLVNFYNSEMIKFIFLITQYAWGERTVNESTVVNSISIPDDDIKDYTTYFNISKYNDYINEYLNKFNILTKPKNKTEKNHKNNTLKNKNAAVVKTHKKGRKPKPKKGGFFSKTRKMKY